MPQMSRMFGTGGVVVREPRRGVENHHGQLRQIVCDAQQFGEGRRHRNDGVGLRGELVHVLDLGRKPARIRGSPQHSGDRFVCVPDEPDIATAGTSATGRADAHAEHAEVVGVDDVRLSAGRRLCPSRARSPIVPDPAAANCGPHHTAPERDRGPVDRRRRTGLRGPQVIQLAGAQRRPQPARLDSHPGEIDKPAWTVRGRPGVITATLARRAVRSARRALMT